MNSTIESIRPNCPKRRLNERVNNRLEALLARVEGIRHGTEINRPTKFNAAGQAHANRIAQQDQVQESGTSTRNHQ